MALKKEILSLNFEKGLNQKASDRVLNLPFMADIQNARMEKTGEVRRRAGLEPVYQSTSATNTVQYDIDLSSGTNFTKTAKLATYNDELVMMDNHHLYTQLPKGTYQGKGVCDAVTMTNKVLRDDRGVVQSRPEIASLTNTTTGDWLCAVWYEIDTTVHSGTSPASIYSTYTVYAQLYEGQTMAEVGRKQEVATTTFLPVHTNYEDERAYLSPKPRLLTVDGRFIILFNTVHGTDNHLRYRVIDIGTTPTLGAVYPSTSSSLIDVGKFANWDACEFIRTSTDDANGIAIFARLDSGSIVYKLQEYKLDSGQLSTSGMRAVYNISTASVTSTLPDYDINNPNPYAVFVRYHKPNNSSDTNSGYILGYNHTASSTVRAYLSLISGASDTLTLSGSVYNDSTDEGILNGSATLTPDDSAVMVYFVVTSKDSSHKPNVTRLRAVKVLLSNSSYSAETIATNTGLLSDPWIADGHIYFMGSECIAPKAKDSYAASTLNFSAGSTFIFRDTLSNTPAVKTIKRDRCFPVAKTSTGDVACNPFINFYTLNADVPEVASHVSELAANVYYGCSAVVTGNHLDERIIGSNQWSKVLTSDQATFAPTLVTVSHKPYRNLPTAEFNNSLLIGGGFLKCYDGVACRENGFFRPPQIAKVTVGAGSLYGIAGKIDDGTYQYIAIYEFVDAAGNLHRSAPSDPITVKYESGGTNQMSTMLIYSYNHSQRCHDDVRVALYRTTKTQSTYYRVGDIANNWDGETIEIYDTLHDDTLFPTDNQAAAHEALYIAAEKPPTNLGSITDIEVHKNRVMLAATDNRVHACKPGSRGFATEVYSEADFQFGEVETGTEKIHGIASIGSHLVVLTENNLYAVGGEGPDANGGSARFTDPQLLRANRPAIEGTIHVTTPEGLVYQSDRGFYLVTRELEVAYFGAPVEDLGVYRGIAATVDDSKHELYIALGDLHDENDETTTLTGYEIVLVYNYLFGSWFQFTYDKSYLGYNSPGMTMYKSRLHLARMQYAYASVRNLAHQADSSVTSGIWRENEDKFWDSKYGTSGDIYSKYSTVVETPFIYTNKLQGAQRVYKAQFLGDYKGDHDITVEMTVDYDDTSAHSQTKTASTLTDKNIYQVPVKRQKNRALKIKHSVTPNSASTIANEMFRLDGIALEVGFKPTTFALPKGDTI